MKLVTKHGREIEINPAFYIDSSSMYIKGELSTAYMDEHGLCIFLKGANNLLADQDRIELVIDTDDVELFTSDNESALASNEANIEWGDFSVKLDANLAKMLYYNVYDPENKFLKNLRDYGVRQAN